MTARHILSRWERVRQLLQRGTKQPVTHWLLWLYVADQAETSMPSLALAMRVTHSHARMVMRQMERNGLLVFSRAEHRNGRPLRWYRPTPALFAVLGVKPQREEGVAA